MRLTQNNRYVDAWLTTTESSLINKVIQQMQMWWQFYLCWNLSGENSNFRFITSIWKKSCELNYVCCSQDINISKLSFIFYQSGYSATEWTTIGTTFCFGPFCISGKALPNTLVLLRTLQICGGSEEIFKL